jgi:DNA primase
LAIVMDIFTRAIRGWNLSRSLDGDLTLVALPQNATWSERAEQFVLFAEKNITAEVRAYLEKERGLSNETSRAFRLGYNPKNIYEDPKRWGLDGKKIWLPRGIVIPGFNNEQVSYIKIRRPMQNDILGKYIGAWTERDGAEGVKFGGPRGGRSVLFRLEFNDHLPVLLLTEGEWDTMLIWEYAADLCDVGTLGGAQSKFDSLDLAFLTSYLAILVVHDDDKAGERGRSYISKLHAVSERIVPIEPPAHDLTDFWKSGGDLRLWIARQVCQAMASALNQSSVLTPMRWRKVFSHLQNELALSEK